MAARVRALVERSAQRKVDTVNEQLAGTLVDRGYMIECFDNPGIVTEAVLVQNLINVQTGFRCYAAYRSAIGQHELPGNNAGDVRAMAVLVFGGPLRRHSAFGAIVLQLDVRVQLEMRMVGDDAGVEDCPIDLASVSSVGNVRRMRLNGMDRRLE